MVKTPQENRQSDGAAEVIAATAIGEVGAEVHVAFMVLCSPRRDNLKSWMPSPWLELALVSLPLAVYVQFGVICWKSLWNHQHFWDLALLLLDTVSSRADCIASQSSVMKMLVQNFAHVSEPRQINTNVGSVM